MERAILIYAYSHHRPTLRKYGYGFDCVWALANDMLDSREYFKIELAEVFVYND